MWNYFTSRDFYLWCLQFLFKLDMIWTQSWQCNCVIHIVLVCLSGFPGYCSEDTSVFVKYGRGQARKPCIFNNVVWSLCRSQRTLYSKVGHIGRHWRYWWASCTVMLLSVSLIQATFSNLYVCSGSENEVVNYSTVYVMSTMYCSFLYIAFFFFTPTGMNSIL